jgi:hypothetical protein
MDEMIKFKNRDNITCRIEARSFTSRLTLCAIDHARDTGGLCTFSSAASDEAETAVAFSEAVTTSLLVVENSLEMRSLSSGFAENNQSQIGIPRNPYRRASTGNNLSWNVSRLFTK